jgi:molybdopterin molybdotransferase
MKDPCNNPAAGLLTIDQALLRINQAISSVTGNEKINLKKALERVLAETVTSPINIPPERVSAMDGYAFSSADIIDSQSFTLQHTGTSWAGKPYNGSIQAEQCVRIFTGAVVPKNADSIIMQEHVTTDGSNIIFPANSTGQQNIRAAGSDRQKHETLLSAPKKISAIDCALLASAGIYDIAVKRKVNIAFFSTGDELTPIGQALKSGQIYDSNRYALNGLLKDECFAVADMGVIADNRQLLEKALLSAAKTYDVIITTGGASVGEADYIEEILAQCGQVDFWKIAMKPGKPLAFGKIGDCLFFGLPGNPVSAVTTFQKIVLPALQQLSGAPIKNNMQLKALCRTELKKVPGRQEYQRGILSQLKDGEFIVETAGQQDSHHLSALSKANCYIVLSADCLGVKAGEQVIVEPFDHLL